MKRGYVNPHSEQTWDHKLSIEFTHCYKDSFSKQKKSQKIIKRLFLLFSHGEKGMTQPQLYRCLHCLGMGPKDPTKETIFMEFDRSKNETVEVKEFLKGLTKRAKQSVTCKPCDFGPNAHILEEEEKEDGNQHVYKLNPGDDPNAGKTKSHHEDGQAATHTHGA